MALDHTTWQTLLRLAAGIPCPVLPPGLPEALPGLTASPLSALGRLTAPLVASLAASGDLGRLPADMRARLLARRDDAIRADLAARRFVARLLAAWPAGIPVALVKGAACNGTVYGPHEPRNARDLDLVVPADDGPRAAAHLAAMGGHELREPGRPAGGDRTFAFDGPIPQQVDLHEGFVEPTLFQVDAVAVWARSLPWPHAPAARLLAPDDALVHLAAHGLTHARLGARALVDAHRLITRGPVDWRSVVRVAADWQAATPLHALLQGVVSVLGTPVPPDVLAALAPARWRSRLAASLLLPGAPDAEGAAPPLVRRALAVALLEHPGPALAALPAQAWRRMRGRPDAR